MPQYRVIQQSEEKFKDFSRISVVTFKDQNYQQEIQNWWNTRGISTNTIRIKYGQNNTVSLKCCGLKFTELVMSSDGMEMVQVTALRRTSP